MRARSRFCLVAFTGGVWLASASAGVGGQTPQPPAGTGLILGTIVDAGTNKGIAGALVRLSGAAPAVPPPSNGGSPATPPYRSPQVISDSGGRFLFRDLPPGTFNFYASAPGYVPGAGYGARRADGAGQPIELADGARVRDVALRLWKYAAISGTVIDDLGEPVAQASVTVMRRELVAGARRVLPQNSVRTDDRGMYRISSLSPGDYTVGIITTLTSAPISARDAYDASSQADRAEFSSLLSSSGAPFPSIAGLRVGDAIVQATSSAGPGARIPPPASDGRLFLYPTVYHPAAASLAETTVVTLQSGEERRGVDLALRLVPTNSVSGTVTGPDGPAVNIGVRLIPVSARDVAMEDGFETATTMTDAAGRFTLLGAPAGAYTVRVTRVPRVAFGPSNMTTVVVETATGTRSMGTSSGPATPAPLPKEPALWAMQAVTVGTTPVAGVNLTLRTGGRLTGRVEFEGTQERPAGDVLARTGAVFSLEAADGRSVSFFASPRLQLDATGQLNSTGIVPGKYLLRVRGPIGVWTAKSAMFDGRDILDEPFIADGGDISGVVLTYTDHPSRLSGQVSAANGTADKTASVILFPADRTRWVDHGSNTRILRLARATTTGAYTFASVPPGDYFVIAVDDAATTDWSDPKRLETFVAQATRLKFDDGETRTLDLKTVVVR